jgi:hypothetical protein
MLKQGPEDYFRKSITVPFLYCTLNEMKTKFTDLHARTALALNKIAPSGGRRKHFCGISCEKIMILRQKIIFFPIVGVFRVKNHDFLPENHIFSNFRGRHNIWIGHKLFQLTKVLYKITTREIT